MRSKKLVYLMVAMIPLVLTLGALSCATQQAPTTTATQKSSPAPAPVAPAVQPIVLKGDTLLAPNHPTGVNLVNKLNILQERSKGRLKFDISYAEALVKQTEALDAVGRGTLDFSYAYPPRFSGSDARFDLCAIPFGFSSVADGLQTMRSTELGRMIDDAATKFNAKFVHWDSNMPSRVLSKKPIRKMEDVNGLKMRAAGAADLEAVKRLGASPVAVVTTEIYPAMDKGIIDAAVLQVSALESYKLIETAKSVTMVPFVPFNGQGFFINLDTWKKLPKDLQDLIDNTYKELEADQDASWTKEEQRYVDNAKKAGIEVIYPDKDEIARWVKVAGPPVWEWLTNRIGGNDGRLALEILKKHWGIQ